MEEKALLHFVREKLADYKVPKRVVVMPALPRNATGKILKTALRQQAGPGNEKSKFKVQNEWEAGAHARP